MTGSALNSRDRVTVLDQVDAVRVARRALLDQLSSGATTLASVLARGATDPVVAKTRIGQIVRAVPGYGPVRAAVVLNQVGIADGRRVAGLTAEQAAGLINAVA
jgi:hypothetical protein